ATGSRSIATACASRRASCGGTGHPRATACTSICGMATSIPPELDLRALPALPRDEAGPVFKAPWEAQAFAMTVSLHMRGVFAWREWADALAAELAADASRGEPDDGARYYEPWPAALATARGGQEP